MARPRINGNTRARGSEAPDTSSCTHDLSKLRGPLREDSWLVKDRMEKPGSQPFVKVSVAGFVIEPVAAEQGNADDGAVPAEGEGLASMMEAQSVLRPVLPGRSRASIHTHTCIIRFVRKVQCAGGRAQEEPPMIVAASAQRVIPGFAVDLQLLRDVRRRRRVRYLRQHVRKEYSIKMVNDFVDG